ncbi:MAG: carboxypeptidase-like regulatory domain-containing protein [Planctomycetaceae bacterium]|jgi:hypothetical protein|nr:carboxypeptidase-like regulatory domain-containing protein [Planctomycetaceae bacterium]
MSKKNFNFRVPQVPLLWLLFVVFCVVLLSAGCGNNFVPFSGKVTDSNGQPYTKGYVVFTNDKTSARGKLQADGTYKLDSLKDGDGLAPGKYQVFLAGFKIYLDDGTVISDIDEKYERPDTSGLSCEVTSGGHYDFTVELKQNQ